MPLNKFEEKIYNFDKNMIHRLNSQLDKNTFYLGGEIKMKHNDIINLYSIQKIRDTIKQRARKYCTLGNSWESSDIYTDQKELEYLENMYNTYMFIMKLREKEKSNEPNSNYNI
jgi:hypothetical protein